MTGNLFESANMDARHKNANYRLRAWAVEGVSVIMALW
jgi:hypothetical protein